ncbi:MAG: hypothetical protein H6739_26095 [Alphaproteobacteria bacterium]|nr:hypothetical protein [Alphaproteobacteria bacterium]
MSAASNPSPTALVRTVQSQVPSGAYPVVAEGSLSAEQRTRVAAWLGVDTAAIGKAQAEALPVLLGWSVDRKEAQALEDWLEHHGVPATTHAQLRGAFGSPLLSFLFTAVVAAPLLVPPAIAGLWSLAEPLSLGTQLVSWLFVLAYIATTLGRPWRKSQALARAQVYERSRALTAAQPETPADATAAELRVRALHVRRVALGMELSQTARDDLLGGLEGVLDSLATLGGERQRAEAALRSESAQRLRARLRDEPPAPGSAHEVAAHDLAALEAYRKDLVAGLERIGHDLDALDIALARLSTADELPTDADVRALIDRARNARDASAEVVRTNRPSRLPVTRTLA